MEHLTRKQNKFVKEFIETGNGTQAALAVYDTEDENTAAVIAHENLRKPKILKAIEEALPDDILNQVHLEGLYATKPIYSPKGDLVAEDADFSVRAKYLELAYKRRGLFAPDRSINVNVEVEASPRLKEISKRINEALRPHGRRVGSDGAPPSDMGTEARDKDGDGSTD